MTDRHDTAEMRRRLGFGLRVRERRWVMVGAPRRLAWARFVARTRVLEAARLLPSGTRFRDDVIGGRVIRSRGRA